MSMAIKRATASDGSVSVQFQDGKTVKFEDCWLRDNCRCPKCYGVNCRHRTVYVIDVPETKINDVKYDESGIEVKWDDNHLSPFPADFLYEHDFELWTKSKRLQPILWKDKSVADKVASVPVSEFLNTEEGARRVFKSLLDYGVAFVEKVDPSSEGTEKVVNALGGIQRTVFGAMWEIKPEDNFTDIGFTNLRLALHTDNSYLTESTGLIILHSIESDNVGGNTVLVDGFDVARRLKQDYPEDYKFLTRFNMETVFIEDYCHYSSASPIIRLDPETQEVVQIRFNAYDRSPMAFSSGEECRSYYRSLRNFVNHYEDPDFQWQFKLRPGTVMVLDNFRMLHGRTSFSGKRTLCGSYVSRSDWLNLARHLKLIK